MITPVSEAHETESTFMEDQELIHQIMEQNKQNIFT